MIIQVFFKFRDFSMHGTFFRDFQVFHDFKSSWEPCIDGPVRALTIGTQLPFELLVYFPTITVYQLKQLVQTIQVPSISNSKLKLRYWLESYRWNHEDLTWLKP